MSIRHLLRRIYPAFVTLVLMLTLPCIAQNQNQPNYKTSASIKQSKTADAQACKGRMNCYNKEMRMQAAIGNADRRAQANPKSNQSKKKKAAAPTAQPEVQP